MAVLVRGSTCCAVLRSQLLKFGDSQRDEGCGKNTRKACRQWSRCFNSCVRIFNDGEDEENTGISRTMTQVLMNRMKLRSQKERVPSESAVPLVNETTASAAVSGAERKVVVRVRDQSDSVSDVEPATRNVTGDLRRVGPLATLRFLPTVEVAERASRDQQEGRAESDREQIAQSQSLQ